MNDLKAMKVTKDFVYKLEAARKINDWFYADGGSNVVVTKNPSENMIAKIEFEEPFDNIVRIYSLSDFLSFLRIFERPKVVWEEDHALIVSGSSSLRYEYSAYVESFGSFREPGEFNIYGRFEMTERMFKEVFTHHRLLKTDKVMIGVEKGCVSVISAAFADGQDDANTMIRPLQIDIDDVEVERNSVLYITDRFFNIVPADYEVLVGESRKKANVHVMFLLGKDNGISYCIVCDQNSTFIEGGE